MGWPKTYEEFWDQKEGKYKRLLLATHHFILKLLPEATVKFQWGGPHYYVAGHLCYINPDLKTGEVYIGFIRGFEMPDAAGLLRTDGGTKQIKKLYIHSPTDLVEREEVITETIMEAVILNEQVEWPEGNRARRQG